MLKNVDTTYIPPGFRKTGIYPLSKDVISMEKLFSAECLRPNQESSSSKGGKRDCWGLYPDENAIYKALEKRAKSCPKCSCNLETKTKV